MCNQYCTYKGLHLVHRIRSASHNRSVMVYQSTIRRDECSRRESPLPTAGPTAASIVYRTLHLKQKQTCLSRRGVQATLRRHVTRFTNGFGFISKAGPVNKGLHYLHRRRTKQWNTISDLM